MSINFKVVKRNAICVLAVLAIISQNAGVILAENYDTYPYPDISIDSSDDGTVVYMENDIICELEQNRYLRFRDTNLSDNWVGCERKGADLCIAFADAGIKGIDVTDTQYENDEDNGCFTINVTGRKPQEDADCTISYTIKGIWMSDVGKFKYTYETSLDSDLEGWYKNSVAAQQYYNKNAASRPPIEITDYHIEQIAHTDRVQSPSYPNAPLRYEWFLSSEDGTTWEKFPKVHVPYPTRSGNYITIKKSGERMTEGGKFGFTDSQHGGWMSEITSTTSGINFELCWYFFDVHIIMYNAVPPRGTQDRFQVDFSMDFDPIDADYGNELVENAAERDWRSLDEYALPLFSRNNTFDTMITDIPSTETAEHYVWWASSYDCFRDDSVGYDDNYSVSIKRDGNPAMPAAWNTYTWGRPFEDEDIKNHRYRLSAMVKTENCTGDVRMVYAVQKNNADLFYGSDTHLSDGTPRTDIISWQYSNSLTGTNDWTPLSMEFIVNSGVNSIILEQNGGGQCWFDNVVITDLGEVTSDSYYVYNDFEDGDLTDWSVNSYGSISAQDGRLVISTDGKTLENNLKVTKNLLALGGRWVADIDMTVNTKRGTLLACENLFNIEISGSTLLSKTGDSSFNRVDTAFEKAYQQGTPINLKLIMDFDTKEFELYYNGEKQDLGNGSYIRSGSISALRSFLMFINTGYSGEIYVDRFMLYPDTDTGAVNITAASLQLNETTVYSDDLLLPQEGIGGAEISWSSSDNDTVDGNGKITRGNTTKSAYLTANIEKNDALAKKQFFVRVAPYAGVTFKISSLSVSDSSVNASATVANDTAAVYDNALLVMACYYKGVVESTSARTVSLAETAQSYSLEAEYNESGIDKIRFFLWDNTENKLMPISDAIEYSYTAKPYLELLKATAKCGEPVSFVAYEELNGKLTELAQNDYNISGDGAEISYDERTITFSSPGIKDILITTENGASSTKIYVNDPSDTVYIKGSKAYQSDFDTQTASDYTTTSGAFTIENVDGTNVLSTKKTSTTYDSLVFGPQLSDYMVEMEYNMVKPIAAGADAIGIAMRVPSNNNRTSYRAGFMERSKFGGNTLLYNRLAIGRAKGSNISDTWHYASYTDSPLPIARDTYYKLTSSICDGKITASLYDTADNLISSQSCATAECDYEKDGTEATALTSGKTLVYYHGLQAYIKNISIYEFDETGELKILCSNSNPCKGDVLTLNTVAVLGDSTAEVDEKCVTYTASSGINIDGRTATVTGSGEQYIIATYSDPSGKTKSSLIKFNVE